MRLRLNDPALAPELLQFLQTRADVIADRADDGDLEVSLIGSYNTDAMRMQLFLLIRAWEAGRSTAGVAVEITD